MKKSWLSLGVLLTGVLLVSGCSTVKDPATAGSTTATADNWRITPNAVGPLRLGMTAVEAEAALGQAYVVIKPPAQPIVVINAQHVVRDGAARKMAEFLVEDFLQPNKPGNPIVTILAMSPRVATAEGVTPEMTVDAAVVIYGPAKLRKSDEEGFGGEWVTFPRAPAGLRFAVSGPEGGQAGLYEPGTFESAGYVQGARIHAIEIGRMFLN